jgi:hypothetical protein
MPEFDLGIRQIQFIGEKIPLRLKGLSRDQLRRRPSGQANPIIWILGHIATGRGYLLDWIGAGESHPVEESEEEMFGIGCQLKDGDPYPPMDHLLNMIERRGRAIEERLRALNEEEASTGPSQGALLLAHAGRQEPRSPGGADLRGDGPLVDRTSRDSAGQGNRYLWLEVAVVLCIGVLPDTLYDQSAG